jgi:transposase
LILSLKDPLQTAGHQAGGLTEISATAKALDYSLLRRVALTQFAGDGQLSVNNNRIDNQIRPIAISRNNWLFAGRQRAALRAAGVTSLIQSARMNRHDPYGYLRPLLTRLPSQKGRALPGRA